MDKHGPPNNYTIYINKLKPYIPKGSGVLGNDNLWMGFFDDYKFNSQNAIIQGRLTWQFLLNPKMKYNRGEEKSFGMVKPYVFGKDQERDKILFAFSTMTYTQYIRWWGIEYVVVDQEFYDYATTRPEQGESFKAFLKNDCDVIGEVWDNFYSTEYSRTRGPRASKTVIYKLHD